ncbi:hypothetical protein CERSUDRAFT_60644, partial [Gelatoporia subvermispora B]
MPPDVFDAEGPWRIGPISTPRLQWGQVRRNQRHECRHCKVVLLTGEKPGFCCGPNGSRVGDVQPLPPLPPQYDALISHPAISASSRSLNLLFSFAALESSHPFPVNAGPQGFFAVQGRIYHRVRPNHSNSAVRWLLIDGFAPDRVPHSQISSRLPSAWLDGVRTALLAVNPLVHALQQL